jgi:hypothetical protein
LFDRLILVICLCHSQKYHRRLRADLLWEGHYHVESLFSGGSRISVVHFVDFTVFGGTYVHSPSCRVFDRRPGCIAAYLGNLLDVAFVGHSFLLSNWTVSSVTTANRPGAYALTVKCNEIGGSTCNPKLPEVVAERLLSPVVKVKAGRVLGRFPRRWTLTNTKTSRRERD